MPRLVSLSLENNCLTGTLPAAWRGLATLELLALQNNKITGAVWRRDARRVCLMHAPAACLATGARSRRCG